MTAKKRKVRKQTSDRVSRIAAKWLAFIREFGGDKSTLQLMIPADQIAALCASCLSQDETKGKRK